MLIERVGEGLHPRIVGVVPAYNEERYIASVVITALQYAERVIVVDDGSSDRTAVLARIAGAEVVQLPGNCGKGRALNAGFDHARQFDPDVIVMLDADAQHDPAEIPAWCGPFSMATPMWSLDLASSKPGVKSRSGAGWASMR